MAKSQNGTPKPQIEAIQTVPPYTVTDPRQVWKVSTKDPNGSNSIFKGSLNVILFFDKAADDSGWLTAGWIKESLGRAFRDQPLLSGRLRRGEDGDLEIVANDSGARLFEAKIDVTLRDFLGSEDAQKAEAQLVFWKDVDEQNPQFSPLFYVQVTNFQCGGYSIGISCFLLLAEILIMDNFLQKWAKIHRNILPKNKESDQIPIFYLPILKPQSANLMGLLNSTTRAKISQTVIYKISSTSQVIDSKENLALFCLEEAHKNLGVSQISPEFGFLVKESPEVIRAEKWKKNEIRKPKLVTDEEIILKRADLEEYLGLNEASFREGSKPLTVSYWIGSGNGEVQAIAFPSYDKLGDCGDLNIIVTIPNHNYDL